MYNNVIHHHPVRILLRFLAPGSREVWTKHAVIISDGRGGNRSVLDLVISHHLFKVSLIRMANNYLGFASNFFRGDFFLGEILKILLDCLQEFHILSFLASMDGSPVSSLFPSCLWNWSLNCNVKIPSYLLLSCL